MSKRLESNEDRIRRGEGRVPTKGAMAAERASAGLGTSDDEDTSALFTTASAPVDVWARSARKTSERRRPAPPG